MGSEVGDSRPVLRAGAVPSRVVEDRPQFVVLRAGDVGMNIDDDAAHRLTGGRGTHHRLVAIERKALVTDDRRDELEERRQPAPERHRA